MTASERATTRGILLAIDLSPESRAAAELAAELATALGTAIEGLFVEDRELLELAGHPLAWELEAFGSGLRPLERAPLERRLRAQAARARALLASVANRRGVSWRFQVARGSVVEEIRTASLNASVVTLGRIGWSRRPRMRLGRTARSLLTEGGIGVLIPGRHPASAGSVVACYDGTEAGRRALDTGVRLARSARRKLRVELVGSDETHLATLRDEANTRLADVDIDITWRGRAAPRPAELVASRETDTCGFLIVPASALGDGAELLPLVSDLECPLLLVR